VRTFTSLGLLLVALIDPAAAETLKVGCFEVDASPPVGSPLAYDPTVEVQSPLSCRGIVLLGAGEPIVLCAVDWIGISNDGNRIFREELARAAETTDDRVAVHTLHQHDAPRCDFSAEELARNEGVRETGMDAAFARDVIRRAAQAVAAAVKGAQPVTHIGLGEGVVEQVASNRRILGPDGKVKGVRYTATKDPALQAAPEGVVDRKLKSISLWNGERRLVVLTYYATHPQSYYRTGKANPDFPGIARNQRQEATGVPHVHFNGAGGNIGAGKYNDGRPELRPILAERVERAMTQAWNGEKRAAISARDVAWKTVPVAIPPARHLDEQALEKTLMDQEQADAQRINAAFQLVWLRRCRAGETINLSCLTLGKARVLHMPGELFVEYQLAAQELRPDLFVAMAAYGEYATWYIGTEIAYSQGGYETSPRASIVAAEVEGVLVEGLRKLLDAPDTPLEKLGVAAAQREAAAARQADGK
jgi:hypothetical protein